MLPQGRRPWSASCATRTANSGTLIRTTSGGTARSAGGDSAGSSGLASCAGSSWPRVPSTALTSGGTATTAGTAMSSTQRQEARCESNLQFPSLHEEGHLRHLADGVVNTDAVDHAVGLPATAALGAPGCRRTAGVHLRSALAQQGRCRQAITTTVLVASGRGRRPTVAAVVGPRHSTAGAQACQAAARRPVMGTVPCTTQRRRQRRRTPRRGHWDQEALCRRRSWSATSTSRSRRPRRASTGCLPRGTPVTCCIDGPTRRCRTAPCRPTTPAGTTVTTLWGHTARVSMA